MEVVGFLQVHIREVSLLSGWVNPDVQLPQLSDQFSYKVEVSVPAAKHTYSSAVSTFTSSQSWKGKSSLNEISYTVEIQVRLYSAKIAK